MKLKAIKMVQKSQEPFFIGVCVPLSSLTAEEKQMNSIVNRTEFDSKTPAS